MLAKAYNFTRSKTTLWVFFTFLKKRKRYLISKSISHTEFKNLKQNEVRNWELNFLGFHERISSFFTVDFFRMTVPYFNFVFCMYIPTITKKEEKEKCKKKKVILSLFYEMRERERGQ